MLNIDFVHVYNEINVLFPDIIAGTALTISVSDQEITITENVPDNDFKTALLEEHLTTFIRMKAG